MKKQLLDVRGFGKETTTAEEHEENNSHWQAFLTMQACKRENQNMEQWEAEAEHVKNIWQWRREDVDKWKEL